MSQAISDRLGICSWSLHPKTPEQLVEGVQDLNLKVVQLALTPHRESTEAWGDAPKKLRDAGIRIASGMFGTVGEDYSTLESIRDTGGLVPDQHWQANLEIARDVARIARDNDIELVSFHAGFIPHDQSDPLFATMLERIRTVADCYADHGLQLLFETGQETAADLMEFLDVLDRDNVGVNFDPANMILYGKGDPIEALAKLLPRIKQVHIKDALPTQTPGTWGTEVAIGDGAVDWQAFMQTLRDGNYTGDLIIEREAGEDRRGDVRTAISRINPLI